MGGCMKGHSIHDPLPRAPEPTAPDDLQREIESAIRPRTGCWPSTVEIVAAAIMDVLRQRGVIP